MYLVIEPSWRGCSARHRQPAVIRPLRRGRGVMVMKARNVAICVARVASAGCFENPFGITPDLGPPADLAPPRDLVTPFCTHDAPVNQGCQCPGSSYLCDQTCRDPIKDTRYC